VSREALYGRVDIRARFIDFLHVKAGPRTSHPFSIAMRYGDL